MKNYLKNLKTELESRAPQMSNEVKQTTIVTQPKRTSPLASMFSSWQRVAAFCVALVLVVGVGVLGTTHLTNNGYQANDERQPPVGYQILTSLVKIILHSK